MAEDSASRFYVAFHRTRAILYFLIFPLAFAAEAGHLVTVGFAQCLIVVTVAFLIALALYFVYDAGLDRQIPIDLNFLWMATDVLFVSWGVAITGGIKSPWFIWYLTSASAAAFVSGRRAAYGMTAANSLAYFAVLYVEGDLADTKNLYVAAFRMLFLAGASYFLLRGIANLQERRMIIRAMRLDESRKVEELTRLAAALEQRTRELNEANTKIREADRLKTQFLANMSHELRTPMNSIIGFSEILVERLHDSVEPKHLSFLQHILASGQHLLGIINDILDLSKIEAGKMELFPEQFELRGLVEGVCSIMKGSATKQRVGLVVDIPTGLPLLETDGAKLKQILYNLLSNAIKFSPPQSTVTIRARHIEGPDRGVIEISVLDQGIGIAAENHDIIFQEFRQVDSSSRREFSGTGLGLALVRKFVELQNGTVRVESALGEGSKFLVELPVAFDRRILHATDREVTPTPNVLLAAEPVLVVEDDSTAFDSMSRHLRSGGYVPIRARHATEALSLARRIHPVAITLDLVLPGTDGWEVLKQLKADPVTRHIPVVIVSMIDNRELGVALGADDYFLKPVDRNRLVERIQKLSTGERKPKPRLLLIDDDEAVHELLDREILRLGYKLSRAFSGAVGLELARREVPDAVILDLVMSDMSGFEVADALKEDALTAHIPIFILTSKDLSPEEREQLKSKIAAFVPKEASSAQRLISAIQQLESRTRRAFV